MTNGGIIGRNNKPGVLTASGIWKLTEQESSNKKGSWQQKVVKDGLNIWLDATNSRSYPGVGSTWFDLSGNNKNGTINLGVSYSSLGYFSFDGSSGYVTLPLISSSNSNITLQAMIYLPSANTKGTIFVTGNASGSGLGVGLNTLDVTGNEIIGLFPGIRWIDTDTVYGAAGWYLMTMILNSDGTPSYYRNTSFIGEYAGAGAKTPEINAYLGRTVGDEPSGVRAFGGFISSFLAYTKVLSPLEIEQNFNAIRNRYNI
jgi:hypothetical protein